MDGWVDLTTAMNESEQLVPIPLEYVLDSFHEYLEVTSVGLIDPQELKEKELYLYAKELIDFVNTLKTQGDVHEYEGKFFAKVQP